LTIIFRRKRYYLRSGTDWAQSFPNKDELLAKCESFIDKFLDLIKQGLSVAVYTQTTDVEIETNGLMTYDRKVVKMPAHAKLYHAK
jgi:hypothetical protein